MSNHACGTALACRPLFTLSMLAVTTVLMHQLEANGVCLPSKTACGVRQMSAGLASHACSCRQFGSSC